MPNLEEDRFENYLKQFQPLAPEALPVGTVTRGVWRRRTLVAWAMAAAAIAIVVFAFALKFQRRSVPSAHGNEGLARVEQPNGNLAPLTLGAANALLAQAPSYREALSPVVFRFHSQQLRGGNQSALSELRKEKTKL